MDFDLDARRARLGIGELADFTLGPRDPAGGPMGGAWRAQLGIHWHRQLRAGFAAEHPAAEFEVAIEGEVFHRGWTLRFTGRIDQLVRATGAITLREIKTVTRALPADEAGLRADYPAYFAQAAAYAALLRGNPATAPVAGQALATVLVFVEADSGLVQEVALSAGDAALFGAQVERVAEFLDLRLRARERLRALRFRAPFARLRPGQESAGAELAAAVLRPPAQVLLEAPTGFGKTGVLLEFALGELRSGRFERLIYLTGKSTGQLQVGRTLGGMIASGEPAGPAGGVAVWTVRPKSEHCVNAVFHCLRDSCRFLDGMEERWPASGLARFYLTPDQPRDLPALRAAGEAAGICPYEITRAALAANDVWIGDYNYVFAPANRRLFDGQPGFAPARTLLLIDEAHNLPSRVADAYSHQLTADQAQAVGAALHHTRAPASLVTAWESWTQWLEQLEPTALLAGDDQVEARRLLPELAALITTLPVDHAALGPRASESLWQIPSLITQIEDASLPRLWWSPRRGTLALTCLDAAAAIGGRLREFGGVVLATATPGPVEAFAAALGLDELAENDAQESRPPAIGVDRLGDLTKRDTRRLSAQLNRGADLLREQEARTGALAAVRAFTPWREGAYRVAFDLRVDTAYQQRARHYATTARTVEALARPAELGAAQAPVAVFFSSYAYAEAIVQALAASHSPVRPALQPRLADLAAQAAWMEEALARADALFLVLGSSFAESIDLLGGRVGRAMVVGPALPEVNAVQQARMATRANLGREAAFRRVYQIPGMQKVNQALGRLVRAPGQKARVLLHCRRFAEADYTRLLAADYQAGPRLRTDAEFEAWAAEAD
jgi:DNA excision repair protein ERCC-2